jgi:hypothetical protein
MYIRLLDPFDISKQLSKFARKKIHLEGNLHILYVGIGMENCLQLSVLRLQSNIEFQLRIVISNERAAFGEELILNMDKIG